MLYYAFANKKCYLKAISLFISIPIACWLETFRSPASRLAGDFCASDSWLAGDQKVSCQPAGRRPRLRLIPKENAHFYEVKHAKSKNEHIFFYRH